jgi:hypothetical protein
MAGETFVLPFRGTGPNPLNVMLVALTLDQVNVEAGTTLGIAMVIFVGDAVSDTNGAVASITH